LSKLNQNEYGSIIFSALNLVELGQVMLALLRADEGLQRHQ